MPFGDRPYYTVTAEALAKWIEGQPERWWFVDGDPHLSSLISFPCPGDELTPELRKVKKRLLLDANDTDASARGQLVDAEKIEAVVNTMNKRKRKTLGLAWEGSNTPWLLIEDEAMVAS